MTAAAANVNTPQSSFTSAVIAAQSCPVKGGVQLFAGTVVVTDANGFATKSNVAATGLVVLGLCVKQVDNTAGADGAARVSYRPGVYRLANHGADLVTQSSVGTNVFLVDDNTVAKTSGGSTRSVAGKCVSVDATGVFVAVGLTSIFG